MIGGSVDGGSLQTSAAKARKTLLTVTALLVCIAALGITAARGLSEETAACEQYGCVDDPTQTQMMLTEDIGRSHSGSSSASPRPDASARASVTASAVAETGGEPVALAAFDPVASASASAASAEETPTDGTGRTVYVSSKDVNGRGESDGYDGVRQLSSEKHLTAEKLSSSRSDKIYPYDGKRCEDRYCGIDGAEGSVECATYKTTASQKVYGCVSSKTYEKKDCYEVTFYTLAREPYNNMDTCSGEEVYAPPEPPEGAFQYWDPPDDPQYLPDLYGHVIEQCQVGGPYSPRDPYCGLQGAVPKNYECNVYYDTAYGTVRGCAPARLLNDYYHDYPDSCAEEGLHLYDEVGREIGTANLCPKVSTEECETAQCGQPVPLDWSCRMEHWNFGELYEGERRTLTRCADPRLESWWNRELSKRECHGQLLAIAYDEQGRKLDTVHCLLGGGGSGGDLGEWAGFAADGADEALNGVDGGDGAYNGAKDDQRSGTGGSGGGDLNDAAIVAIGSTSETPGTIFSGREPSQLTELFQTLIRSIEGSPGETRKMDGNTDVRSTIDSSIGQGGRATRQEPPVENAEVGAEDIEAVQAQSASNGVDVDFQRKTRSGQGGALPRAPSEYEVGIGERQGNTSPDAAASTTGNAVSLTFPSETGASRAGERIDRKDDDTKAGIERTDSTALAPVSGASLDRAPSALVRVARVVGGFGWAKTALAMATLGTAGGILIFRRRMAR